MKELQQSLELIEKEWRLAKFKDDHLPEICIRLIRPFKFNTSLSKILSWELSDSISNQSPHGASNIIALAETSSLKMYLHYWTEDIGTPHQHSWTGFFMNIKGTVIHSVYQYNEIESLAPNLIHGSLQTVKTEVLLPGDMIPVYPGKQYIHGLWHIDQCCLSLSVRSKLDQYPTKEMTLNYYKSSGIAIDLTLQKPDIEQLLKWLKMHSEIDTKSYHHFIQKLIQSEDVTKVFFLLYYLLRSFGDINILDRIISEDYASQNILYQHYYRFLSDIARDELFTQIRMNIKDKDLRGLYGALYLSKNRKHFLETIAIIFPKELAVEKAVNLIYKATLTADIEDRKTGFKNAYKNYFRALFTETNRINLKKNIKVNNNLTNKDNEQLTFVINRLRGSTIFESIFT